MPSRSFTWKVHGHDDYACNLGNSASSPFQWGWSLPWTCSRDREFIPWRICQGSTPMAMYFPTHPEWYVSTSHFTWPWLQKVLTSCRRMARKLSCMRAEDVQVPPPRSQQGQQTRRSQRAVIDRPNSSRVRRRDEEDDDDGGDDDIDDPTYEQE